jgi:hypothetical protein
MKKGRNLGRFIYYLLGVIIIVAVVLMWGGIIKITLPFSTTLEAVISVPKRDTRLEDDILYSRCVIEHELAMNGTINTTRMGSDKHRQEINKHIQKYLVAIGFYNGDINGDPSVTSTIVMSFQTSRHLKVDGIIGRNTWRKILEEFELKKSQ